METLLLDIYTLTMVRGRGIQWGVFHLLILRDGQPGDPLVLGLKFFWNDHPK